MDTQQLPSASDFSHSLLVNSPQATQDLGRQVSQLLRGGEIILLNGPLGAGKTCFIQGLCQGLQVADEVVSPTFTLVNTYTGSLRVHHLDFYRVEDGDDLTDIGVPDFLDEVWDGQAVLLVEWPFPLLKELGPGQTRVEMLGVPGPGPDDRRWYFRGIPELPQPWQDILTSAGGGPC